ncbi:hypothetical protein ACFFHH_12575 [Cytobacillus solani]|uniref:Uncharacterized protein n=1 Tax=Cytobacillus solani TaxID=1637975 RepID=A0A0Q3QNT6_9BACI|nr:hypothetical protein [Cytobacillus solani]KOP82268.1 hypothetical protein AMS60_07035 [Bacillus sp. FJAT-21945]KQL19272.1 hypothetical protein AN957_12280 [Cytobacillus solani]
MKILELDEKKLGQQLLAAPLTSHQANHKWIKSTMQDYILPSEENLEGQFVHDLYTKDTQSIIDKWYGGKEGAAKLIHNRS